MVSVRLQRIKEEYGDKIVIKWKSYPLRSVPEPGRKVSSLPYLSRTSRMRAAMEEESIPYSEWPEDRDMPAWSIPALEAAKCAELQGEDTFNRYHFALLKAYYVDNTDISEREALIAIASEVGLDMERFIADLDSGRQRAAVVAEFEEACRGQQFLGIPTVFFNDWAFLTGGVPVQMYRRAIDKMLEE